MDDKCVHKLNLRNILDVNTSIGTSLSARTLEAQLLIPHGETAPRVRKLIAELIDEGMPIVSDSNGYRVATDRSDVDQYVTDLIERAMAILARAHKVQKNWNQDT